MLNAVPGQLYSSFSGTTAQKSQQTENSGPLLTSNIRSNSFDLQSNARQILDESDLTPQHCMKRDVSQLKDVSSIFLEKDASSNCSNLDTLLSIAATNAHRGSEIKVCQKEQLASQDNTCVQRKTRPTMKNELSLLNCDIARKVTTLPWLTNSPSPPIFGRQPSFPDVFSAADDPDFLFGEITKNNFATEEEGLFCTDDFRSTSDLRSPFGSCSKSSPISSSIDSTFESDQEASSTDESEAATIMDFLKGPFHITI